MKPIFIGFVIGEASGDGRPMIGPAVGRRFEKIDMIAAEGRPIIGRQSADGWSIRFYQRIVGRQTPIVARLSADHKMWFVIFFIMHVSTLYMKLN